MPDAPSLITHPLPDRAAATLRRPRTIAAADPSRYLLAEDGRLLTREGVPPRPVARPIAAATAGTSWRLAADGSLAPAGATTTRPTASWHWHPEPATAATSNLPLGVIATETGPLAIDAAGRPAPSDAAPTRFAHLDATQLATLRALLSESWHSSLLARVLPPGEIRWRQGFVIALGETEIPLASLLGAAPPGDDQPDELACRLQDGRVEWLRRFRPLVAYAAFGTPALFATLAESIDALRHTGGYTGEVAILTNLTPEQLATALPLSAPPYRHCPAAGEDRLDYTAARFGLTDHKALAASRPVLYLDTDVICDRPVGPVLEAIFLSGTLCLSAEHSLLHHLDFYGASLFDADPTVRPQSGHGASNGVIGLASMEVARAAFPLARRALAAHVARHGRETLTYMDQAMGSYVWHKTIPLDLDILSGRVVNLGGWRDEPPDDLAPRGFMHFSGGIGAAEAKLGRMRRYRRRLDAWW